GAWIHVGDFDALVASPYGRTLLLKVALVGLVIVAGAYHFLRARHHLEVETDVQRFRASATLEIAAGIAVLLVTAVLIATPPPTAQPGQSRAACVAPPATAVLGMP